MLLSSLPAIAVGFPPHRSISSIIVRRAIDALPSEFVAHGGTRTSVIGEVP